MILARYSFKQGNGIQVVEINRRERSGFSVRVRCCPLHQASHPTAYPTAINREDNAVEQRRGDRSLATNLRYDFRPYWLVQNSKGFLKQP
jgi:hypothetical protein